MSSEVFEGKVIIFSAPSGAGKTSIVHSLLKSELNLEFSISACTRKKRVTEIYDEDYYFISIDDFKNKINNNDFLEWEEVYKNDFYGTMKSEIQRIWNNKNHVIFDVDVKGGVNLKNYFQDNALSVFISPPSLEDLKNRLTLRDSEEQTELEKRIIKAKKEMEFLSQFDKVIMNDVLENACKDAYTLIKKYLNSK